MERYYTSKEFWKLVNGAHCLHCGNAIKFKPYTLGIEISPHNQRSIKTKGLFDTWLCVRSYAIHNSFLGEDVDRLTTQIMQDFGESCEESEDIDGHKFVKNYSRFSEIPLAPERDKFQKYGGEISYEEFRKGWVSLIPSETDFIKKEKFKKDNYIETDTLSSYVEPKKPIGYIPKNNNKASSIKKKIPFVGRTIWSDKGD